MPRRIHRRQFIRQSVLGAGLLWLSGNTTSTSAPAKGTVKTLTSGPNHHFFGYYGITPWNQSEELMVCLESPFQDRLPGPEEAAAVGLVDVWSGKFLAIGETRAWNLQQGAMLHWNPLNPETEILFNDRQDGEIVAVALNIKSGKKRTYRRAISALSHDGRHALSLTYGRLTRMRPVVGYVGAKDPYPTLPHPDKDGVFLLDLVKGKSKLVVSIEEVYRQLVKGHPELKDRHMWFNHTVFNKDDTRFLFLARTWTPEPNRRLESAMFTCNLDGSDLREVIPYGSGVSHFDWKNEKEILATFRHDGDAIKHVLFTDGQRDYQVIGEGFLAGDGHCSFAPKQLWIATDEGHPQTKEKSLKIFNLKSKEGVILGTFPMKEYYGGDLRCDLHPRWNRMGDAICFDALETKNWTRQLHIAHISFRG